MSRYEALWKFGEQEGRVAPRPTLTPLSCSPNVPSALDLDIRTLTHEPIAKWRTGFTLQETVKNAEITIKYYSLKQCGYRSVVVIDHVRLTRGRSPVQFWSEILILQIFFFLGER